MRHKGVITITFTTSDEKEWEYLLEIKNGIASGEFQRDLSYRCRADKDSPAITPKVKVTATFKVE